jgi:dipeptidyl aminopeptidase/acylaminoacyl peptidase
LALFALLALLPAPAMLPAMAGAAPLSAPAQGQIAYVKNHDIWLLDLATHQSTQLTKGGYSDDPAWSPDGRRLTFAYHQTGAVDLYTLDLPTQQVDGVTTDPATDILPAYAPSGTLYFVRVLVEWKGPNSDNGPFSGHYLIVRLAADGREQVVYDSGEMTCYPPAALSALSDSKLALSEVCGLGVHVHIITLPNPAPSDDDIGGYFQERLDNGYCYPGLHAQYAADAQWAHHSSRVAFLGDADCATPGVQDYHDGIYVIDPLAAQPTPTLIVDGHGSKVDFPAWSPDDQWLVFQQGDGLAIVPSTGGTPQVVAPQGTQPAWRPTATVSIPGMPVTGTGAGALPLLPFLAAALLIGAGTLLRRRVAPVRLHR